jgi:hypothetical protein
LIKILKRGSPGLPRDFLSSGDLPIARIQAIGMLEFSWSLSLRPGLSENSCCFGSHFQCATQSEKIVSRQRINDRLRAAQ